MLRVLFGVFVFFFGAYGAEGGFTPTSEVLKESLHSYNGEGCPTTGSSRRLEQGSCQSRVGQALQAHHTINPLMCASGGVQLCNVFSCKYQHSPV